MPEAPFQPPNPRHSRYRHMPVPGMFFPVTVMLAGICLLVAMVSRLGHDKGPVHALYFAEGLSLAEIESTQEKLQELAEDDEMGATDQPSVDDLATAIDKLNSVLHPDPFEDIRKGQIWRLFTPIFLHFGMIHLLFNMLWLWQLGRVLEATFRGFRFGLLVAAVALVSNCAQAYYGGSSFGGMSGVIYGLFGFIVVRSKYHPAPTFTLDPQTVRYMLIWLVLCFTGMLGPIANAAHLSGLIAGGVSGGTNALMGGAWGRIRRRQQFYSAIRSSENSLHRCATCGLTEHDNPMIEFRVSQDGEEYCQRHLPPHI